MNPSVYPTLSGDAGVSALVGTRIYPVQAPQDVTRPYIVYTPVGLAPEIFMAKDCGDLDYDRVAIDCWSSSYPEVIAMAAAARKALDPHGYLVGGFVSDREEDTKLFRQSFDWGFWTT